MLLRFSFGHTSFLFSAKTAKDNLETAGPIACPISVVGNLWESCFMTNPNLYDLIHGILSTPLLPSESGNQSIEPNS